MSENKATHGGVGCFTLLGLLFIGLKLGGAITWSWWWVLAPFWVPLAIGGGLLLVILVLVYFFPDDFFP
jgi:hypothetical protein